MAVARTHAWNKGTDAPVVVDAREDVQRYLDVLDDADCRTILEATGEASLSATELSETCDIPLSTAYRKLDRLTDAGLLDENIRVRRSGKHVTEYARGVEEITVAVAADGGFALTVE